jgi:hypothetical protein
MTMLGVTGLRICAQGDRINLSMKAAAAAGVGLLRSRLAVQSGAGDSDIDVWD